MSKELVAKSGRMFVTKQCGRDAKEENEETTLEVREFQTATASVSAKYGFTINMGDYESARVDVMITLPCYVEEIDATMSEAWAMAKSEIITQVKEVKAKAR